jgi:CBS domain containing-hemolysin-like protein
MDWRVTMIGGIATIGIAIASIALQALNDVVWHELKELCQRRDKRARFDAIYDGYEGVVVGLQVSIVLLLVTLAASAVAEWLQIRAAWSWQQQLGVAGVGSVVLLMTMVWIPVAVGQTHSTPVIYHLWPLLRLVRWIALPFTWPTSVFEAALRRMTDEIEPLDEEEAFEEEILAMVTEGLHDGHLEADAREMIEGVIALGDANVADIMTPRSNMDVISIDLEWQEMVRQVATTARTRLPVYQDSLENIIGVLYVKDLLVELSRDEGQPPRPLREILREVRYVPESQPLDDLLQDFLRTRNHLAMVVDEYNGVVGLVTIEDVLEEIVGEIVDESDDEQAGEIHRIDANVVEIYGRAHLAEVNEELGLDLPEPEDFDTIAGFVIHEMGRIPKVGEVVEWGTVRITVLDANDRKIERVQLESLEPLAP